MISLTTIFKGTKDFKAIKITEGQNDNFVTTLQAIEAQKVGNMEFNSKITLYISLTNALEEGEIVPLVASEWYYFESTFESLPDEQTGEVRQVTSKWLQRDQS